MKGIRIKSNGQSMVGMAAAILIIVPVFFGLIDLYFIITSYWASESVCHLATRSASQGPPDAITPDAPKNRALQIITASPSINNSSAQWEQYDVSEQITELPDPVVGGSVTGSVTVQITVSIKPPYILRYFLPGNKLTANVSDSLPYTWVQKSTIP